jgi:hypothetical protein
MVGAWTIGKAPRVKARNQSMQAPGPANYGSDVLKLKNTLDQVSTKKKTPGWGFPNTNKETLVVGMKSPGKFL